MMHLVMQKHLTLSRVFGPSGSFGFLIVCKVPSLVMLGHSKDSHHCLWQQSVHLHGLGCDIISGNWCGHCTEQCIQLFT